MKINQIIQEAGTGLEIDRSIPGRTIARISGDVAYRTGSPSGKKLPDHHPDDDYTPWSGKVGASIHDDEEDTFDVDYMGDDGELKEFVSPQVAAQDPGLEPEKSVDVVFYGQMPRDFTADTVAEALEAVLPREYPPGSSDTANSNVYRVVTGIAKDQGAVVTTKPLSIAQKLVKTFQTYGIKCTIRNSGLDEGVAEGWKAPAIGAAIGGGLGAIAGGGDPTLASIGAFSGGSFGKAYGDWKKNKQDKQDKEQETANKAAHDDFVEKYNKLYNYFQQLYSHYNHKFQVMSTVKRPGDTRMGKESYINYRKQDYLDQIYRSYADLIQKEVYLKPDQYTNRIEMMKKLLGEYKTTLENLDIESAISKGPDMPAESVNQGVAEAAPRIPDPQNYDSDWDYYNDRDAEDPPEDDWYDDPEVDDDAWFDESREKVGNMDADAFDDALARLKKLAGAGPLRTVYDPNKRVYRNVPQAVQPAQQPRKAK